MITISEKDNGRKHYFYNPENIKVNLGRFRNLLVIILSIAIPIAVVGAGYWIYSQVISVSVSDYALDISASKNGLEVIFTGQLLDPSGNPVNGADIVIYRTDSDGMVLETIATVTTDATGHYSYTWTASTEGTYYFKSGYQVS